MDDDHADDYDVDHAFRPVKYSAQLIIAVGLVGLVILTALVWGGWKLITWL